MPLYSYRCEHCDMLETRLRGVSERDDAAACPRCEGDMKREVSLVAPPVVRGRRGKREAAEQEVVPTLGSSVEEHGGYRVVVKGTSLSLADWRCGGCGHGWWDVYEDVPPVAPACPKCGCTTTTQITGVPHGEWSSKLFAGGGYFDRGAGRHFSSKGEREQWMRENGVVDANDVDQDAILRKQSEKEAAEREFMAGVVEDWDADADIRKGIDQGRIPGHESIRPQ